MKAMCGYCRKLVRDKPVIGTLHVCLTEEERCAIDFARWQWQAQRQMRFGSRGLAALDVSPPK